MKIFNFLNRKKQVMMKENKTLINKEEFDKKSDEELLKNRINAMEKSIHDMKIDEQIMEESIEIIKERDLGNKAIISLFELMQRNPLSNFGTPGAMVHYLESLDGYEKYLINSIKNNPTLHTLWMLNRCINKHNGKEKEYLKLMKEVSLRSDIDTSIKAFAKEFVEYQEGNN